MTRWLQAARAATAEDLSGRKVTHDVTPSQGGAPSTPPANPSTGILSVLSILSGGANPSTPPPSSREKARPEPPPSRADGLDADAGAYADFLRLHGPSTYGVAARELGIGGTRAWRAEERLRELGLVVIENGKAKAADGGRQ